MLNGEVTGVRWLLGPPNGRSLRYEEETRSNETWKEGGDGNRVADSSDVDPNACFPPKQS